MNVYYIDKVFDHVCVLVECCIANPADVFTSALSMTVMDKKNYIYSMV